jgi:hypothetical protein
MKPACDKMDPPFSETARAFNSWAEGFDAQKETIASVTARLDAISFEWAYDGTELKGLRIFKPSERWQTIRRRAAEWYVDGYTTDLLPNDDGTQRTACSFAYDIADFDELLRHAPDDESDHGRYLAYVGWGYALGRIAACKTALRGTAEIRGKRIDPFRRITVLGKNVRFVSWRTSSSSHVSEDSEEVRGASTLCGGEFAFHKHTQQQWSRYACTGCYAALRGEPPPEPYFRGFVEVADEGSHDDSRPSTSSG